MVSDAISPIQRRSNRKALMVAGGCGILAAVLAIAFLRGAKGGDSSGAALATTAVVMAPRFSRASSPPSGYAHPARKDWWD